MVAPTHNDNGEPTNDRFSFPDGVLQKEGDAGCVDHPQVTFTFPIHHKKLVRSLAAHHRVPEAGLGCILYLYFAEGDLYVRLADEDFDPCVASTKKVADALRNAADLIEQGLVS